MASTFFSQRIRSSLPSDPSTFICKTCRRNAATYRRTRKALRVSTDPAFAPSQTETQHHIIFNPPPSAPNVYHTPAMFLPKSDPRRAMYITASRGTEMASDEPSAPQGIIASIAAERAAMTPPARSLKMVRTMKQKKYHLDQSQIDEIRRLRKEDPRQWTRERLAEKFECSQFFVSLCCSAPDIAAERKMEDEAVRSKWGRRKRDAREARVERKKKWGMDA